MKKKYLESGFTVIGIAIRTTNNAASAHGTIQALWQKFFNEQTLSKIENKIDNAVIALYYNFENNRRGEYDLLIGAKVSSDEIIPAGMIAHTVPAQKRTIFTSKQGPKEYIVFDLWKKIWSLEDIAVLNRTYLADYELYDERSNDPQNACMEIHIGN